jgi:hypothetical protein
MIAQNMPLTECISAIAATLPVCSARQVAYSTFTVIRIVNNRRAEVIQFDNPAVTIGKVLEYSHKYLQGECNYYDLIYKRDGASQIAVMLFEEATDISFFAGKAVNPAHQDPRLPVHFSIKTRLVQEMAENLEKMGKHVKISFF